MTPIQLEKYNSEKYNLEKYNLGKCNPGKWNLKWNSIYLQYSTTAPRLIVFLSTVTGLELEPKLESDGCEVV